MKISIDNLSSAILESLQNYSEEVLEATKTAIDETAKQCNEEIKSHVTFKQGRGKYVKAFKISTIHDGSSGKRVVWHVRGKEASLAHLLEKGHALPQGGRSKAYPHIEFGEKYVNENLATNIEKRLKNDY